jgi:hypothetical protein
MEGSPFEEAGFFRAIAESGGRPKDFEDIRLLEALRREEGV